MRFEEGEAMKIRVLGFPHLHCVRFHRAKFFFIILFIFDFLKGQVQQSSKKPSFAKKGLPLKSLPKRASPPIFHIIFEVAICHNLVLS